MDTELLTCGDAARELNLTSDGIRALERRGSLKAKRTRSGMRLFLAEDVSRLKRERQVLHAGRGEINVETQALDKDVL